jgi:hypothetical protein
MKTADSFAHPHYRFSEPCGQTFAGRAFFAMKDADAIGYLPFLNLNP